MDVRRLSKLQRRREKQEFPASGLEHVAVHVLVWDVQEGHRQMHLRNTKASNFGFGVPVFKAEII